MVLLLILCVTVSFELGLSVLIAALFVLLFVVILLLGKKIAFITVTLSKINYILEKAIPFSICSTTGAGVDVFWCYIYVFIKINAKFEILYTQIY